MSTLDLVLAIAHHLAAFGLLAILVAQYVTLGGGVDAGAVRRLSRIDAGYGLTALVLVAGGFARATLAAKGWEFYSHNLFFWAKVGLFAAIALISIRPTLAVEGWGVCSHNLFFWAKVGLFAAIALISVRPALAFRRWRKASLGQDRGERAVDAGEVAGVRRTIGIELALFTGLPVFAAAM